MVQELLDHLRQWLVVRDLLVLLDLVVKVRPQLLLAVRRVLQLIINDLIFHSHRVLETFDPPLRQL